MHPTAQCVMVAEIADSRTLYASSDVQLCAPVTQSIEVIFQRYLPVSGGVYEYLAAHV